ncbi:MAG TPA: histidine kinase, partial [Flavobacteriales bacterium]|nr:histidine kinase [Flavobacteriales bacterium]
MSDTDSIVIAIVTITAVFLLLIVVAGLLMVVNTSRRRSYQAKLAELTLQREMELMKAEREATQQALTDVGRDLHDNVGQYLSGARAGFELLRAEHGGSKRLDASVEMLLLGIEEVRRLARNLNGDLWQQRTLLDAISTEAERIERVSRIKAQVVVNTQPPPLPGDTNTILFRVFQEILNN